MKLNKNLLVLGFCVVIIFATISVSMVYKGFIYPETDGDDDDDDDSLTPLPPQEPPSESNEIFPEDYFVFIESINFIKGNISSPLANLTQLKYLDDETFDIIGNDTTFEFEIIFEFDDTDSFFQYNCYYDLFLYLNIKTSINPEVLYFQAYSLNEWINLTEIKDSEINIERHYIESTTKFRVLGNITAQKTISLDRLSILLSHYKDIEYKNHKGSRILYHREIGVPNPSWSWFRDYGWTWKGGYIDQRAGSPTIYSTYASTEVHLELDLDIAGLQPNQKVDQLSAEYNWNRYFYKGQNRVCYLNVSLWDFTTNTWNQTHSIMSSGSNILEWENVSSNFINGNNQWRLKLYTYMYSSGNSGSYKYSWLYLYNVDARVRSDYMEQNNHDGSRILYHREISLGFGTWWAYDPNLWTWYGGEIYQKAGRSLSGYVSTELHLEFDLDVQNINKKTEIDLNASCRWTFSYYAGGNKRQYFNASLWDFTTDSWVQTHSYTQGGNLFLGWEDINISKFVNENYQWRLKTYTYVYSETSYGNKFSHFYMRNVDAKIKSDYPDIREITTIPESPINTSESIVLNVEVIPYANPISEVSYFIDNYSYEWHSLKKLPYTNTWKGFLSASNFENGNYTLWVDAIDSKSYSSLMIFNFEIFNARPRIKIITPNYLEKITDLYDYELKINVSDIESDIFSIPEFRIYKNISDPIINWTVMNQIGTNQFNYTIDPINFSDGFYTVQYRSEDFKGYGYNETLILIQNALNITILSLSEIILSKPFYREIICNITGGEPINTAQWDIVTESDVRGNYTWKDLSYNPISEFWEANFNLTDYKWGNYYLVINATNDKYNSTIEIKYLEFRPIFEYYFTEISYTSSPFTISSNLFGTNDVIGNVKVYHDSIVNERTFEIIIPSQYGDANNYYLIRDNIQYSPTQIINNTHTLWNLSDYKSNDIIYFYLEKPSIINEELEEDDEGILKFEFSIISKYSFSKVLILNEIDETIDLDLYEIKLYYSLNNKWEKIDSDDYDLDDDDELSIELTMLEIRSGITQFKLKLTPKEDETTKTTRWVATTLIASAIGIIPFQAYGLLTKSYKKMGKKKYLIISIALGVAGIVSGLLLSWFLY